MDSSRREILKATAIAGATIAFWDSGTSSLTAAKAIAAEPKGHDGPLDHSWAMSGATGVFVERAR